MNLLYIERSDFYKKIIDKIESDLIEEKYFVSTRKEAFSLLNTKTVDLIISGQELNDGTARDLLIDLDKTPYQSVPVVIMTSQDDWETREAYFNLGVVDFISKNDFSPEKLIKHLEHYRQQDRMIEALRKAPIAILDDSEVILKVITSILDRFGITDVDTYTKPEDLFASERDYHVYLIDLMLPRMPGEQVIRTLRRKYDKAVIIVISSVDKFSAIVHVLESGADDYLIKPFDFRLLMARLKTNYRHFSLMRELDERNRIMKDLTITDNLTGAGNHRFLMKTLEERIDRCVKTGGALSLLMIDLDRFKLINDQYGHPMGDVVLKELTRIFQEKCGESHVFGRYGGEEFMLIMDGLSLDEARDFCEERREDFAERVFDFAQPGHYFTFSGGLVQWQGDSLEELVNRADDLLYRAKENGRNRIED